METNSSLVVSIGNFNQNEDCSIQYNIATFLEKMNSKPVEWREKLDQFTNRLDDKIRVDPNKHGKMVRDIESIVDRICAQLSANDPFYANVTKRGTGSMYAGLKVGVPHECDILLLAPDGHAYDVEEVTKLRADISDICTHKALVNNPAEWLIHGVELHKAGVCVIMEYRPSLSPADALGVTVDLIPGDMRPREDLHDYDMTETMTRYIDSHNLHEQLEFGLSSMYAPYRGDIDTGLVEGKIVQNLSATQKQGYRVAKYLLQTCLHSLQEQYAEFVDPEMSLKLYGYKPRVKSYYLRVCLLHLLMNTQNTTAASQLTGGVLAVCLLEMLHAIFQGGIQHRKLIVARREPEMEFWFNDPIRKRYFKAQGFYRRKKFESIHVDLVIDDFLKRVESGDVSHYRMLNYPTHGDF